MSRTSVIVENQCKKYFKWQTKEDADGKIIGAGFVYWDKEKGEKGENVEVKSPFSFALLDDSCMTIKGFNEKSGQGIYSNEVNSPEHELVVKSNKETVLKFKRKDYKANKDAIEGLGGKYHQSIYGVMLNDSAEYELINISLKGAALTGAVDADAFEDDDRNAGWMNFKKFFKKNMFTNFIEVKDYKLRKKGKTRFTTPLFTVGEEINEERAAILDKMDLELKEWFKYYFNRKDETTTPTTVTAREEDGFVS